MPGAALIAYLAYLLIAFAARAVILHRQTGSAGFKGISGKPGSAPWWAGILFVAAVVLGAAGPLAQLAGLVHGIAALDRGIVYLAGALLYAAGTAVTLLAQRAMGASWRVGVDEHERTELVTSGTFAIVRNPVFAAMLPTSLGLTLLAPNPLTLLALAALALAVELQVRVVEEPYLTRVHGQAYRDYTARVGRFIPCATPGPR